MDALMIAPCGMNCALCYAYQRDKNHCDGCRSDNIPFEYCRRCMIKTCQIRMEHGWADCSPCDKHCQRLKQLDKRYRTKYGMSMLANLETIRIHGMDSFLQAQAEKWACADCGSLICVHRGLCLICQDKSQKQLPPK